MRLQRAFLEATLLLVLVAPPVSQALNHETRLLKNKVSSGRQDALRSNNDRRLFLADLAKIEANFGPEALALVDSYSEACVEPEDDFLIQPTEDDVFSPADGNINITDEGGIASFIELPEDTLFTESLAHNDNFQPHTAYVALLNNKLETHVYAVDVDSDTATHAFGPLESEEPVSKVMIYGSALSSDGTLYLACWSCNSVMAYSVETGTKTWEVQEIAAPNDVGFSSDEATLYVVGGTFDPVVSPTSNQTYTYANPGKGQVYTIDLSSSSTAVTAEIVYSGFDTFAGFEDSDVDDSLFLGHLYDMLQWTPNDEADDGELSRFWRGNDGNGFVWFSDNIEPYQNAATTTKDYIVIPCYDAYSELLVDFGRSNRCGAYDLAFQAQLENPVRGHDINTNETLGDALYYPSIDVASLFRSEEEGAVEPPIRLVLYAQDGSEAHHFTIDLVETRANHPAYTVSDHITGEVLGTREYFNSQVTHTSYLKDSEGNGYFANINFEQPRILMLKESAFTPYLSGEGPSDESFSAASEGSSILRNALLMVAFVLGMIV